MNSIRQIMMDGLKKNSNKPITVNDEDFISLLIGIAYRELRIPSSILSDINQLLIEEINFKKTYLGEAMPKGEIFDKFYNLLSTFYLTVDVAKSIKNTMNTISGEEQS